LASALVHPSKDFPAPSAAWIAGRCPKKNFAYCNTVMDGMSKITQKDTEDFLDPQYPFLLPHFVVFMDFLRRTRIAWGASGFGSGRILNSYRPAALLR
jgi:hypothetical protein